MADSLQIRAGNKANMPTLADRELVYVRDEKKLYIGDGGENVCLSADSQYVLYLHATSALSGKVEILLYKDGQPCTESLYLYNEYRYGNSQAWSAHPTTSGTFQGSKTWTYGGNANGIAWKSSIYRDSSKSELLACASFVVPADVSGKLTASPVAAQAALASDANTSAIVTAVNSLIAAMKTSGVMNK